MGFDPKRKYQYLWFTQINHVLLPFCLFKLFVENHCGESIKMTHPQKWQGFNRPQLAELFLGGWVFIDRSPNPSQNIPPRPDSLSNGSRTCKHPCNLIAGWWFQPLWKILVNWDPIYGKIENVPNHQPACNLIASFLSVLQIQIHLDDF